MKNIYLRRFLSLLLVVMLVFPAMSFGAGNDDVRVESVYFQDGNKNMVFVDYEFAISELFNGRPTLYGGIQNHVGEAEVKGRPLYLETSNERLLDYAWAMKDNVFLLKDILATTKYDIKGKIDFTHELKVVDGVAEIVKPDPNPDPVDIVGVNPVDGITVEIGTDEDKVIDLLNYNAGTTMIVDSKGTRHVVVLEWEVLNYNKDQEGDYSAIGRFELPEGMGNSQGLNLYVEATVRVVKTEIEEWPKEVADVFVGVSPITEQTYVNLNIKEEYVDLVNTVYVYGKLANQMEDQLSQWRIDLEKGTSVEDLMGRIVVESDQVPEGPIDVDFREDNLLGEGFGLGHLFLESQIKESYPNASQYLVRYSVGNSDDIFVSSDMVNLGKFTEDLVQYIEDMNVIDIELYDANGDLIVVLKDVMRK